MKLEIQYLKKIIKKAGDEVLKYYKLDRQKQNLVKKKDGSPVTKADLASNKIILDGLKKFKLPILSEESKDILKSNINSRDFWVIDPLDGTKDFIKQNGEFSIMVALVLDNQPFFGMIQEPALNNLYYASKNQGAFKEKGNKISSIKVSSTDTINKLKLIVSRNHLTQKEIDLAKKLKLSYVQRGSAGSKIARIAHGKADIYLNSSDKMFIWDTCAGFVILEEAGGKATDIYGKKLRYNLKNVKHKNGFLATNKIFHDLIVERI
ncbi:MAG: 3'(2'),5'-bisphosphate nucleotidase CysQ [Candidatus Moranbacteria bacterium]|nr:3'(2'),5'-bisphosphate nucleotidase CysQ [Candidatus Moranbacteria bacterium]